MWYGDPLMPAAELQTPAVWPQSVQRAMCPPHARTAVALVAVKVTEICVSD
jgi:hypothetical protein